jgi:HEAT repeat protein
MLVKHITIFSFILLHSIFFIRTSASEDLKERVESLLEKGETLEDSQAVEEVVLEIAALGEESLPLLIENLGLYNNPRLNVARKSIVNMGPAVVDDLLEALPGKYWIVQRGIGSTLPLFGEGGFSILTHNLQSHTKPLVRRYCAQALGEMKSALGGMDVKPLIDALNDKEWTVRNQAAFALGKLGDPEAIQPLLRSLQKDQDDDVRRNAIIALKKIIGGQTGMSDPPMMKEAIKPLIKTLHHTHHRVRFPVAECLVAIGEPAVEPLIKALKKSKDYESRNLMIRILGEIGGEEVMKELLKLLEDKDWAIRGAAAEALGKSVNQKILEDLSLSIQKENHPFVLGKLKTALKELENKKEDKLAE